GESADASHVHLDHVDAADVHHLLKFLDIANLLASRDPHGRIARAEACITMQVVRVQRLLQPGEVKRLKLFRPPNGGRRIPTQSGIDHQLDILADTLPSGASESEIAFLALTHRPPAELDGAKALFNQIAADALGLGRRVAE